MLQNMNNPIPVQGAVVWKSALDYDTIRTFQENSDNPSLSAQCYPGGSNQENHDCWTGDIIMGLKNCRNADIAETEGTELGIVGVGGLRWGDYCSQEEMESQFYFIGTALTEMRLSNPLDSTTSDPDHGMAHLICGTHSTINNGPFPFYPGNLVCWRCPPAPFHPKANKDTALFQNGDQINHANKWGTSATQFKFELVPLDPTDFSVQFAGSFAALQQSKADNGISDIPYEWTLCNNDVSRRQFSNLQDQALAFKFGLGGVAMTFIESLIRQGILSVNGPQQAASAHQQAISLAAYVGLFDTKDNPNSPFMQAMADVFMMNISNGDDARRGAENRFREEVGDVFSIATKIPSTDAERYTRLRLHALDQLAQGLAIAWHSKTEKIIGRAFNAAATSDTLDVCFGHFAI